MADTRGELADYATADAVLEALLAADLSPHEMRVMLVFLSGYSPAGVRSALEAIRGA